VKAASRLRPMLSVGDLSKALKFYHDILGGVPAYQPVFVTLNFGETEIGIGALGGKPLHGIPQRPAIGHRIEFCLFVENPDEAVKVLAAHGTRVVMQPQDLPWGEAPAMSRIPMETS